MKSVGRVGDRVVSHLMRNIYPRDGYDRPVAPLRSALLTRDKPLNSTIDHIEHSILPREYLCNVVGAWECVDYQSLSQVWF
jgi:hypothetical protein